MARTLSVCALLVALCPCPAADPPQPTETVIRLTVAPQAAPKPALKYQLLPELREMNPGNPIQGYLKCFMEQNNFFFIKESVENREKWQTMPLRELPLEQLHGYGGSALRQADYAARLDTPDWQILPQLRRDGIHLLLPEVQQLRTLAAALKVRLRGEIAEQRFDDAVRTTKTLFALSRHLGEHPSLITNLVGLAIASLTIGPLEEMLEQPGCPNLYWALTYLPDPLFDLRKGLQGERIMWVGEFAGLDESAPMTEAQLQKALDRARELQKVLQEPGGPAQDLERRLKARVQDEARLRADRERLVGGGLNEAQVQTFPALQVVLLAEKYALQERQDDEMKWLMLPYWQAEAGYLAQPVVPEAERLLVGRPYANGFKVRRVLARLEQRLALLRHVEAVRLYAAAHDGKPPARLADLPVPVPVDPMTGKPFTCKVEGQTVTLQGSPPRGEERQAAFKVRYEVTLRK